MSEPRPAALIPARRAPARGRPGGGRAHPPTRARVWQLLALLGVVALLGWLVYNTQANMAARGIRSGW
ncbi:MAG: hypothetical protein RR311_14545, partial [Comamonas sp.]